MRKLSLVLVLAMLLSVAAGALATEQKEYTDFTEIKFLSVWNGGGAGFPADIKGNPVAQYIAKKTGVILDMESIVTPEDEKLNTLFASGVLPDLINAPHWNTSSDTAGMAIKKAALEGLIYDFSPVIDKYPNVKRLREVGVAKDYLQFDVQHPDYQGKMYIIPQQTPSDDVKDVSNWAYGIFVRKDIAEALKVDPTTIDTPEKLYDFAVQIKNGGFKNAGGNPVIPMGTGHNGWSYQHYATGLTDTYHLSDYRLQPDGSVVHYFFTDNEAQKILFIRKLVAEGLLDPESFSNTDTMAKEKIAIGKCAMLAFHAPYLVESTRETLLKTNPEMEYVRVGPMKHKDGGIETQTGKVGRTGSPVMFIAESSQNKEAVLRFLDYINSEEGRLVARYGVPGVHFDMVNGQPVIKPELLKKWADDPTSKRNEGLGVYDSFIGAYDYDSKYPKPDSQKDKFELMLDALRAPVAPIQFDKLSVDFLDRAYPKMAEYRDKVSTINLEEEVRKVYFTKTEEEALKLIETIRQRYLDAGIQELFDFVKEQYNTSPDKDKLMF